MEGLEDTVQSELGPTLSSPLNWGSGIQFALAKVSSLYRIRHLLSPVSSPWVSPYLLNKSTLPHSLPAICNLHFLSSALCHHLSLS